MFSHGFKEQHENRIIIEDLTFNTVKEMLRFIYMGSVESGASSYENLLKAADKVHRHSLYLKVLPNFNNYSTSTILKVSRNSAKKNSSQIYAPQTQPKS